MKRSIKNRDMLAEEIFTPETEDEFLQLMDMSSYENMFEAQVDHVKKWALTILDGFGLKSPGDVSAMKPHERRKFFAGDIERFRFLRPALDVLNNIGMVRNEIKRGKAASAAQFALTVGDLYARAHLAQYWELPAIKGAKFKPRGRGTGPLRKAIARLLKKNPRLTTDQLYQKIANAPPKGWKLLGAYEFTKFRKIVDSDGQPVTYRRFQNSASEERKNIRK